MNRVRICAFILTVLVLVCSLTIPVSVCAETAQLGETDASAGSLDSGESEAGSDDDLQAYTDAPEVNLPEAGQDITSGEAVADGDTSDEAAEQDGAPEDAQTSGESPDNAGSDTEQQAIPEYEELEAEIESDDVEDEVEGEQLEEELVGELEGELEERKPVLYIVLVDCGTTLYGKKMKKAMVASPGDPNGTLLSLIAAAPPLLCPEANLIVFGYHSDFISAEGVGIIPMSNTQAIGEQVQAILGIEEQQRLSSNLANALSELDQRWIDAWLKDYDCRLVILTGGAMYFANDKENNPTTDDVKNCVNTLREKDVTITAFGYDLTDSDVSKFTFESGKAKMLLLDEKLFEAGEYVSIELPNKKELEKARLEYAAHVVDYFAEQGGFEPGVVIKPEEANLNDDTVNVLWDESEKRYQANRNGLSCGLSPKITTENADAIRACVRKAEGDVAGEEDEEFNREAHNAIPQDEFLVVPEEEPVSIPWKQIMKDMSKALDADEDGALDGSDLQVGSAVERKCPGLNASEYAVICSAPDLLEVTVGDGVLQLNPLAAGEVQIAVSPVAQDEEKITFRCIVRDYRLDWQFEDNEDFSADGESRKLVSWTDGEFDYILERQTGDGQWSKVDAGESDIKAVNNSLDAEMKKTGKYRLSVSIKADGTVYHSESRVFSVVLTIDAVDEVKLICPYFKPQMGQRVDLVNGDRPAMIDGCSVQVEPVSLAETYLDTEKACIYIVPLQPGDGIVTLKDSGGNGVITFALKVNSLTRQPMMWILAIIVPICLIGLTVMVVILISKLRNK